MNVDLMPSPVVRSGVRYSNVVIEQANCLYTEDCCEHGNCYYLDESTGNSGSGECDAA
nr:hypothetical protein [Rubripirellula sp.]